LNREIFFAILWSFDGHFWMVAWLGGGTAMTGVVGAEVVLGNLLDPAILFFVLGLVAAGIGSDLEIPKPFPKLLSLYLLMAIGFRGGAELRNEALDGPMIATLVAAVGVATAIPLVVYAMLRRRLATGDAAAVAAAYGSDSAVTFVAATSLLGRIGWSFGGHMVAALALMESPAILVGVLLYRRARARTVTGAETVSLKSLVREAVGNGSVVILVGSLAIGLLTSESGEQAVAPFLQGLFKGALCLFLLDLGLVSGRGLIGSRNLGRFTVGFAVLVPLLNAMVGISLAWGLGLRPGDAFLFCALCAGASYIAVPAAMRLAIPEANPALYVTMPLALTFPFNLVIGLPLYLGVIGYVWNL
jgi:hypothetical protein